LTAETNNDSDETYNDWANKPTQIIHQYIINNPALCDAATRVVVAAYDGWEAPTAWPTGSSDPTRDHPHRNAEAADALEDYIEEAIAESTVHASSLGLLTIDLLLDTLGRVDWRDIALALLMDRNDLDDDTDDDE
jgi:hypothetical protein